MKYIVIVVALTLIWIVGTLSALCAPLAFTLGKYKRAKNVFTALDQICNAAVDGDPDETLSSRCGKRLAAGMDCKWCKFLCKILDWGDEGHCEKAIDLGEGRNEIR